MLPITPEDLRTLKELQPDGWPDIVEHFEFYTHSAFCQPIKCLQDQRIVGIGTTIRHERSAWLAHIIVHKDFRHQGIGAKVTQALVESLPATAFTTTSLIATDLGEPVYAKQGFVKETDYLFFKREEDKPFSLDPSIRAFTPEDAPGLLALDRQCTGENRKELLDPHLAQGLVLKQGDQFLGFYLPTLNEGLVVALEAEAGLELLKYRLQAKPVVVVPQENETAVRFLTDQGFQIFKKGARMRLGQPLAFRGEMLFGRIGGNLG